MRVAYGFLTCLILSGDQAATSVHNDEYIAIEANQIVPNALPKTYHAAVSASDTDSTTMLLLNLGLVRNEGLEVTTSQM